MRVLSGVPMGTRICVFVARGLCRVEASTSNHDAENQACYTYDGVLRMHPTSSRINRSWCCVQFRLVSHTKEGCMGSSVLCSNVFSTVPISQYTRT